MFTDRIIFSRSSFDESGKEIPASVFFSTLWRLVGWAANKELPDLPPDHYDQWRMAQAPQLFAEHWLKQKQEAPHRRKPFPGESFACSLPLELCCAVDEARQARAFGEPLNTLPPAISAGPTECNIARGLQIEAVRQDYFDHLGETKEAARNPVLNSSVFTGAVSEEQWKQLGMDREIPEFSPTALETLAQCPYRYYVQRVLGLEEACTNELEAQPRDRGSAVHYIMDAGYRILKGDSNIESLPLDPDELRLEFAGICRPAWISCIDGIWRYDGFKKTTDEAMAAVVLEPAEINKYINFFGKICDVLRDDYEAGNSTWMLGSAEHARIEWKKIRASVLNLVTSRISSESPGYRGLELGADIIRCTALVEFQFGEGPDCDMKSLIITDPAGPERKVAVHGFIDRVDLLFDCKNDRTLKAVCVIDYKGSSKAKMTAQRLARDIVECRDCQLPVYGLAARAYFGLPDDVPVICQYIAYTLSAPDMEKSWQRHWIGLDGTALKEDERQEICGEEPMMDLFRKKVFKCVDLLEQGLFLVEPADTEFCRDYCEFPALCRYYQSVLVSENEEADES